MAFSISYSAHGDRFRQTVGSDQRVFIGDEFEHRWGQDSVWVYRIRSEVGRVGQIEHDAGAGVTKVNDVVTDRLGTPMLVLDSTVTSGGEP